MSLEIMVPIISKDKLQRTQKALRVFVLSLASLIVLVRMPKLISSHIIDFLSKGYDYVFNVG